MSKAFGIAAATALAWTLLAGTSFAKPRALVWPACGMVSSAYGTRVDPFTGRPVFHTGIDIVGDFGVPIRAAASGEVVFVGRHGPAGLMIELRHRDRLTSRYAKLSEARVERGEHVRQGEVIAEMGSSGRSTGPHLHFEIARHGRTENPRRYLHGKPGC